MQECLFQQEERGDIAPEDIASFAHGCPQLRRLHLSFQFDKLPDRDGEAYTIKPDDPTEVQEAKKAKRNDEARRLATFPDYLALQTVIDAHPKAVITPGVPKPVEEPMYFD